MRVLALDYGSARCGCALSDPTGTIVTPIAVVARPASRRGLAELTRLVQEREVERVVVGLPLSLRGEDTQADKRDARLRRDPLPPSRRGRPGRALRRALHHAHRRPRRAAQHQRGLARRGRAAGGLARQIPVGSRTWPGTADRMGRVSAPSRSANARVKSASVAVCKRRGRARPPLPLPLASPEP